MASTLPTPIALPPAPSPQDPRPAPLVTVLFLTRNRLHYLRRTVASIREHLEQIEPGLPAAMVCFDNGSSAADRVELAGMGFDLLTLSQVNLGIGPAMNHLVSMVRSPFLLNLQDDWVVTNPKRLPFIAEAMAIMDGDPRIGHIKLDNYHFLEFNDRRIYDGPFTAPHGTVPFYCQDPKQLWGGFCFPPGLTRTMVLHELGPFREDQAFRRGWAESEYTQRYAQRYFAAKSPAMTIFTHIGEEPTAGWIKRGNEPTHPAPPPPAAPSDRLAVPIGIPAAVATTVSFIIPYRDDSPERAENQRIVAAYLQRCIEAHRWQADIIVEQPQGEERTQAFWKAQLINRAVRRSSAEAVAIIDADALVPEAQLAEALRLIAEGTDICYPHESAFLNVPRPLIQRIVADGYRLRSLEGARLENLNPGSFGGAVLFRRAAFWAAGGYNERFRSWGREDVEVHDRFIKLGYRCRRTPGPLFHLDHPRTADSRPDNPHYLGNLKEHERILAMDRHQLLDEVQSWAWVDA
jgi:GT2 family glycosyltransferase